MIAQADEVDCFTMQLPLDSLEMDFAEDGGYQRPVDYSRARKIADAWQPETVGTLIVGQRGAEGDCQYFLVDGSHRREAMLMRGYNDWPCYVFSSRGRQHEAGVFTAVNGSRKKIPSFIQWQANLTAGDPITTAANELLESMGLHASRCRCHYPNVACVNALPGMWRHDGGESLSKTLEVLATAWKEEPEGNKAHFVRAVFWVFKTHGDTVDPKRLAKVLARVSPVRVLRSGDTLKIAAGGEGRPAAIGRAMIDLYNKRLTADRKLPMVMGGSR